MALKAKRNQTAMQVLTNAQTVAAGLKNRVKKYKDADLTKFGVENLGRALKTFQEINMKYMEMAKFAKDQSKDKANEAKDQKQLAKLGEEYTNSARQANADVGRIRTELTSRAKGTA